MLYSLVLGCVSGDIIKSGMTAVAYKHHLEQYNDEVFENNLKFRKYCGTLILYNYIVG